jgi:type IV pilus assembly protein PilY1
MTLSKNARNLILAASLLSPIAATAEDIDLYQGGSEITGNRPNVLIILDNSANWSAANQGWPGGIKQGQSELNALVAAISQRRNANSDIRIGLMMFTDGAPNGGYVRYGIRDMTIDRNVDALTTIINGIKPSFNGPVEKVASAKTNYSNVMYEAYKYFGSSTRYAANDDKRDYAGNGAYNVSPYTAGNVAGNALSGVSGTQYNGPLSTEFPCSKNYIIFIGNGYPSQDTDPGTLGDPSLSTLNRSQIYASSTVNYADEWARFLKEHGSATTCTGVGENQVCANSKILTYTIDVYKDHQDTDQTALLKSMANVGGGTYCQASNEASITNCLNNIFNETQAVDSVFTSASLPVSVNTQGTYLNQIYMGVFRPDGAGKPRWIGNLKEYRFGLTTDAAGNDSIYLADSTTTNGRATPVVNTTTGFLKPSAVSFWTSSTAPNRGFWAFNPTGDGGQYDSPDGDLVEKGAAAQKLRTLGPATRTVYTCPPSGCTPNATPALFNTSNTDVVGALTYPSTSVSLSRSGTLVTGTLGADLGLASPTDTLTVSASNVAAYNATWSVNKTSPTTFTFTMPETPASPATGIAMTVAAGSSFSQPVAAGKVTFDGTAGSPTYGKALVNLASHGFINNQSITMAGATPNNYNGTYSVTVVDANNFYYTPTLSTNTTESPAAINPASSVNAGASTATGAAKCGSGNSSTSTATHASIRRVLTSDRVIVTVGSNLGGCYTVGAALALTGMPTGYNVSPTGTTLKIAALGTNCEAGASSNRVFCYDINVDRTTTTINPASPATGTITASGIPTRTVTSITRTAGNPSNVATVTVTTSGDHDFSSASSVVIAGADQTEYNGTKTTAGNNLRFPTSNTITYDITTGPFATATGGSAARGAAVAPATLIDWIRGVDNKEDENANGSLTDVRASIHGDVLHSRPVVINYGGSTGLVAFYGANDGALRAVKAGDAATDGGEKWAFVAPEHYSSLARLYNNSPVIKYPNTSMAITPTPTKRNYFFDGNIGVYQSPNRTTTHIFAVMRRGGRGIYAFDVSDPDSPRFMWTKSYNSGGLSELGYTWSEPKVVALKRTAGVACRVTDPTTYTRALVLGAGYDPTEEDKDNQGVLNVVRNPTMGRGVFVLDAADGHPIKLLQPADQKKYSFPGDVTLLDTDGDGCVDRVYAVDTGANIHRFDIGDVNPSNWKTYKVAKLGDVDNNGGSDDRKFLYPTDAVLGYVDGVQTAFLLVGSGNREVPRDERIQDMFFMVKDTIAAGTDPSDVSPLVLSDLTEITNFNSATTTINATASSFKGWYLPLEASEKVVNAPVTVAGVTYFGTNLPKPPSNQCTPNLGVARGYAVNYLDGTSGMGDRDADGTFSRRDLYANFTGGGLPPSPVNGVVKIDDKFVRFVIGSGGTGTEGSPIEGLKVQANPNSNRTRAYWYFKQD